MVSYAGTTDLDKILCFEEMQRLNQNNVNDNQSYEEIYVYNRYVINSKQNVYLDELKAMIMKKNFHIRLKYDDSTSSQNLLDKHCQ